MVNKYNYCYCIRFGTCTHEMNCKSQKMCIALWIVCLVTPVHLNIQHNSLSTSYGQLTTVRANFPNSASWLPCFECIQFPYTVTSVRLHEMNRVNREDTSHVGLLTLAFFCKQCMGPVKPSLVEWNRALVSASVRAVLELVLTSSASWV